MKSSMKETKLYFDTMFDTNWNLTEIHFSGEEFNSKELEQWVNIFYQPLIGRPTGLSGRTSTAGNFHVVCWADTELDALELSDTVVDFMDANINKRLYNIGSFELSDHGWNKSNKAYTVVTFTVRIVSGLC